MISNESFSAMILVALVLGSTALSAQANQIVLWNKLGSEKEILNSEIGLNGNIVGGNFTYEPGQFGNGFVRQSTGDQYVTFSFSPPTSNQLMERGTVELWIASKVPAPVPYDYGVFGLVNAPYGPSMGPDGIMLFWGDGVTGRGLMGNIHIDNGSTQFFTQWEANQFVAVPGVPFHVAMTWDVDGIDDSTDTLRVYRDGALIGNSTETWEAAGHQFSPIMLGWSPDSEGFNKFITDNIVVRDYAKSNFDDRFIEVPSIPEPEIYAMLLAGLGLLGFMARRRKQNA